METNAIKDIINIMKMTHALDVSVYEDSFLSKSILKRLSSVNSIDISKYARLLSDDKNEAIALADSLNIGYTEFFRNSISFAMLEKLVFPRLFEDKNLNSGIRIWSAGCSTGQEPYSIAMKLDDLIRTKDISVQAKIFATDVSENALAVARKGSYDVSEVQNITLKYISRYFFRQKDVFSVTGMMKDYIDFSHHDLLDPHSISPVSSIFGDFDLIFCSNILFYYTREIRDIILNKLYLSLSPRGYLITGEAEREIVAKNRFRALALPAAIFQKSR